MPLLFLKNLPVTHLPPSYSEATLARDFKGLLIVEVNGKELAILSKHDNSKGVIIDTQPNDNNRYDVVASVDMTRLEIQGHHIVTAEHYWQDIEKVRQIESICVDSPLQGMGLATLLYETLAYSNGIVLVSDQAQYLGGQGLWKRIAAHAKQLQVYILDKIHFRFHPFDNHSRTLYDGTNISDEEIWSIEPNHLKYDVVLVAESALH